MANKTTLHKVMYFQSLHNCQEGNPVAKPNVQNNIEQVCKSKAIKPLITD